jgi:16S rRNA (uracil1498-N3)-methyltransferase
VRTADAKSFVVEIDAIAQSNRPSIEMTVASAVPKGERADWLVEKLSEIGAHRFIPLQADRSVVLPQGKGKRDRWRRLAIESAKQSRRAGVMQIDELTPLDQVIKSMQQESAGWFFSTEDPASISVSDAVAQLTAGGRGSRRAAPLKLTEGGAAEASPSNAEAILLLIGPEGGWTDRELARMREAGLTPVRLTATILRVETAALVAAAIVATIGLHPAGSLQ